MGLKQAQHQTGDGPHGCGRHDGRPRGRGDDPYDDEHDDPGGKGRQLVDGPRDARDPHFSGCRHKFDDSSQPRFRATETPDQVRLFRLPSEAS